MESGSRKEGTAIPASRSGVAPVAGVLAVLLSPGCMRLLPPALSVEQRHQVVQCLEEQGYREPSGLSAACSQAVWAALSEVEVEAGCHADSDCIAFPMIPSEGPCWNATGSHWLGVHPQTGSLSRVQEACGYVDGSCYPESPPEPYCDAGRCRLRGHPPPMSVPRNFKCPGAGLD